MSTLKINVFWSSLIELRDLRRLIPYFILQRQTNEEPASYDSDKLFLLLRFLFCREIWKKVKSIKWKIYKFYCDSHAPNSARTEDKWASIFSHFFALVSSRASIIVNGACTFPVMASRNYNINLSPSDCQVKYRPSNFVLLNYTSRTIFYLSVVRIAPMRWGEAGENTLGPLMFHFVTGLDLFLVLYKRIDWFIVRLNEPNWSYNLFHYLLSGFLVSK